MAEIQVVAPRATALQYDGTNSAAILDFVQNGQLGGWGSTTWSIGSEEGGALVIASSDPGLWSDYAMQTGDHLVFPIGEVVAAAHFSDRYTVLDPV